MSHHLQAWKISAEEFPDTSSVSDQLEFMLGYAILAPSPLNTQPWRFRLRTRDVEICADPTRQLTVLDPDGRELILSCGAVLQNLKIAAEYFGYHYQVEIEPEKEDPDILARFSLGLHGETSSEDIMVFNAIPQRRACRRVFDETPIPEELLSQWREAAERQGVCLSPLPMRPLAKP